MPKDHGSILSGRAQQLAKHITEQSSLDPSIPYVRFRLGKNEQYGISYQYAVEVMHHVKLTSLICVPPFIAGIINRRGFLLTIVDLKQFLFKQPRVTQTHVYVIVVFYKNITVGILADSIEGSDHYNPALLDTPITADKSKYILGIDRGTTAIINVETILSDPQLLITKNIKSF